MGNSIPQICQADDHGITKAAQLLTDGAVVALPTETVYGLAARADSDSAVAAIYTAKGRPAFNPLIVHVRDITAAERLAVFNPMARMLAEAFWPGPLTMVLPLRKDAPIAPKVSAGLATVALRSPAHPVMQRILSLTDFSLAAPSANRSGAVSPTCAAHVAQSLQGRIPLVIDGGPCAAGVESTIVALRDDGWQVLRPGIITASQIETILGPALAAGEGGKIEAPGQLPSHYSPGKPVRLGAMSAKPDEFFIGFGPVAGQINLSVSGDLAEAASGLYAALHQAANAPEPRVAIAPVPEQGIGLAINDRLRRAAV